MKIQRDREGFPSTWTIHCGIIEVLSKFQRFLFQLVHYFNDKPCLFRPTAVLRLFLHYFKLIKQSAPIAVILQIPLQESCTNAQALSSCGSLEQVVTLLSDDAAPRLGNND